MMTASALAHAQPCNELLQVPSPGIGTGLNVLRGVNAGSADVAWAVGHYRTDAGEWPLAMRRDGTSWTVTPMPTPPSWGGVPQVSLRDVHAFSPNDAWAVGANPRPASAAAETLVYRWDGSSWSIVSSPAGCCGSFGSQFYAIDGVSGNDFWAVGEKVSSAAGTQPLAAHWNGSNWQEYLLPNVTSRREALKGLHVRASDDIWALEGAGFGDLPDPRRIFHWNGSSWSEGAARLDPLRFGAAEAIFAFGPGDIWVSSILDTTFAAVMLHWNGTAWTEMNVPIFAADFFGDDPNDFYAAGATSVMHWDGTRWSIVASLPGLPQGNFFAADLAPDGTLWCAGNTQPGPDSRTLTARFTLCTPTCVADMDNGTGSGSPDGGVGIEDLLYYLALFGNGDVRADLDDGSNTGTHDGGVTIDDLLYFLVRYDAGC
jgi:hypothetical protein